MPMLSPYRVLDLTDERGQLTGKVLSDLGAEVILVEPPGGSRSRRVGPFVDGHEDDPEHSLWFWSYNRGKRSVVLDLDTAEGQARLGELAAGADLLVESADAGVMAGRGLAYEDLAEINPALVYTSISPFGRTGPKAGWLATDLVVVAAGMHMYMQGDEDRPPLRIPLDQAFLHASAEAATASLIALHERHRSGRGQHVDVSAQQAIMQATQSMAMCHLYNCPESNRAAGGVKLGPFHIRLRSPAADGYVSATILFGESIGPFSERLFRWIHEEGMCELSDVETDWINFVGKVATGEIAPTEYARIQDVAAAFTATKTKAELLQAALDRRLLIVPIATVADVAESEQYATRDFWRDVEQPQLGTTLRYPGPMARFTETPLEVTAVAPTIGAHSDTVLSGPARTIADASPAGASDGSELPLSDVKILDFMWVMAGPAATRVLADYGAQIVRVESTHRVETARTIQPFLNDEAGAENSGLYQNMNAGKLGITIDLSKPESRDLVMDLVRWADVVTESFSPHAKHGMGLTYDDLRLVKPDIIMASSCLFGQSGPLSSLAGFGTMGASMSGFYDMTGWPDREPAGCFGAYTDYVSPRFLAASILAALDHRARTGEGQYIDLAQSEASIAFLAPALLDYEVNGRLAPRPGNAHPVMVPHAVYPAAGEDRWVAIACQTDDQWRSLCEVIGMSDELQKLDAAGRRARESEIDTLVSAWTSERDGIEIQDRLQAAGVPAHRAQQSHDLVDDPQLVHRQHFHQVDHAEHGAVWVEGSRFMLSRTPARITSGGPTYGQHTFDILGDILGYDGDRIAELAVSGVLE
jgi:crotonobetainyl-CoA:carnitine CoA-transferase CaiB-like acyl-CoA transferase